MSEELRLNFEYSLEFDVMVVYRKMMEIIARHPAMLKNCYLRLCVEFRRLDLLNISMREGFKINYEFMPSPLFDAIMLDNQWDDIQYMKCLISLGCDLHAVNALNFTPLMCCVRNGNTQGLVFKKGAIYLLQQGAIITHLRHIFPCWIITLERRYKTLVILMCYPKRLPRELIRELDKFLFKGL